MTMKDLSSEIEQLKKVSNEKDDLIKALSDKVSVLQNWAQENFSNICKKISENENHHFKNEKILVKCESCEETFDQIWRLEVHMETHAAEKHFVTKSLYSSGV